MPHSRSLENQPRRPRRGPAYAIAALVAFAVLAIAAWLMTRPSAAPERRTASEDDIPVIRLGEGGAGESGEDMAIQIADEDDPTRVASEIFADRFEPISATARRVEMPVAWVYLEDGRTVHIRADNGRFESAPGSREPDRGTLRGDVRLRLFAATDDGSRPEPGVTPPTVDARIDAPLSFDLRLGTVRTQGRLTVESESIDFAGAGVTAYINEPEERIDLLTVERGERVTFTPDGENETPVREPTTASIQPANWQASPEDPPPDETARPGEQQLAAEEPGQHPAIDHYEITLRTGVRLERGSASLDADALDVWLRLVDNQLPSEANGDQIAAHATPRIAMPAIATALAAAVAAQPIDARPGTSDPTATDATPPGNEPAPLDLTPGNRTPVNLTWNGPLEMRWVEAPPEELDGSDLVTRFTALQTGAVRFRIEEEQSQQMRGTAAEVWFDETQRRVRLLSTAGGVTLESPASGRLSGVRRMEMDLETGVASVIGEGELIGAEDGRAKPDGAARRRSIRWTQTTPDNPAGARFQLKTADGQITGEIDTASFTGDIRAVNDESRLEAGYLEAAFEPGPGNDGDDDPRISLVRAESARTDDGNGGALDADELTVYFTDGTHGEDADPTRLIARGAVRGRESGGGQIDAGSLNTRLARNEDGDVIVTDVRAGRVERFEDGRGRSAKALQLRADLLSERATLTGAPARIAGPEGVVEGRWIELRGQRGMLAVSGPGSFERPGEDAPAVEATWSGWMHYDDQTGTLLCSGGARATARNAAGQRDTLTSQRVRIELGRATAEGNRAVRFAVAEDGGGDDRARVERRRVIEGDDGDLLAELYTLDGERIELDNEAGRVTVPGPGMLVLVDQRSTRDEPLANEADATDADERGDAITGSIAGGGEPSQTLIEWTGSMVMTRKTGRVVFEGGVRIVHRPLTGEAPTIVDARTVDAVFSGLDDAQSQEDAPASTVELVEARARGDVAITRGPQTVLAGRVRYDAEAGLAEAEPAETTGRITVIDIAESTQRTAARATWDFDSERIRVERPGPVTVPTGVRRSSDR